MEIIESIPSHIKEIFDKINEVRTNPQKLANKLTLTLSYIDKRGNQLKEPNKPIIKLNEGIKAFDEAITFLKAFKPVSELTLEDSITKIAQEHANDIGHKGVVTNDSSDGKIKFQDRFKKYGTYTDLQEILLFGESDSHRIVMNLIVCDGDSKRANRDLILSEELKQIGIGFDNHIKYAHVAVIDLARNWKLRQIMTLSIASNSDNKTTEKSNKYSRLINEFPVLTEGKVSKFKEYDKVNNNVLDESVEDLIDKYDKELDQSIHFDDFIDRTEEKQIIQEGNSIKLLKKITFTFSDGNIRKVILSKTWNVSH